MPRKKSFLEVTDQFCGAGGSSQGVRSFSQKIGGGLELKLALNHWPLAIATHNTNFPNAIHDCTDISAANPRRYPSTDILITSPECTNHTNSKGKKVAKKQIQLFEQGKLDPAAERSRATMWDVPRFAEYHNYNNIIVEQVVDAREWIMYDAWLHAMYSLGYVHKCVYLNSMHCHPTPQSRDRMYIHFWKKGNRAPNLEFTPNAHCPKCSKEIKAIQTWKNPKRKFGDYRTQYVYCCPSCAHVVEPYFYACSTAIDLSDIGTLISERKKPLAINTIARIEYGLKKYHDKPLVNGNKYKSFLASYYGGSNCTKYITEEMGTITTVDCHALITYKIPHIQDCHFRMLQPPEVKKGMAFDENYIVLGSGKDQVMQLGNAVTPPAMEMQIERVYQSLN